MRPYQKTTFRQHFKLNGRTSFADERGDCHPTLSPIVRTTYLVATARPRDRCPDHRPRHTPRGEPTGSIDKRRCQCRSSIGSFRRCFVGKGR